MAEVKRIPRWLKLLVLTAFVFAGLWLWLDSAFRAPDVIPILRQEQFSGATDEGTVNFDLRTKAEESDTPHETGAIAGETAATAVAFDCSSPERIKAQLSSWVDSSFGAELTELLMSGAISWSEKHPATLRESWAPGGPDVPASYLSYSDNMLEAAAANGDAMAAAVFGAKQVNALQRGMYKLDPEDLQAQLETAERYLEQGIRAKVSGALQFYWRSAEIQAARSRVRGPDGLESFTNRKAVIDTHARMLLNQMYGSFEERSFAHMALAIPSTLPYQIDDGERKAVLETAKQLASQFAEAEIVISAEERRAENAVVAFLRIGLKQAEAIERIRCSDGRPLKNVLPEDAFEDIIERYGFAQ